MSVPFGIKVQMVDISSDLAFAFQCRAYWLHLQDVEFEVRVSPETFSFLYHAALAFVIAPYAVNILSTISITRYYMMISMDRKYDVIYCF